MPLWTEGRDGAVDVYDAQRGLARLKAGLGLADASGRVKAGRYEILELTGAGGFGRVYHAHDPELERDVALKALSVSRANADEAHRIARAEAQTLAGLSHPNIIEVYDVFVAPTPYLDEVPPSTPESDLFIVMPFVRGRTLDDWIAEARPSARLIVEAYVQAARGLAAAHQAGLVHRDFKPTNAMREEDGRVVILDFGVATVHDAAATPSFDAIPDDLPIELTIRSVHHQRHGGTPAYMAPEQHEAKAVSPATDVYAFGVSLYEALAGDRPFKGTSGVDLWTAKWEGPPEAPSSIDPALFAVIRRSLAPRPADRWPSMESMLDALLSIGSGRGHRRRAMLGVSAAAAIGVAAMLVPDEKDCSDRGTAFTKRWAARRASLQTSLAEASVAPRSAAALVSHLDAFVADWAVADRDLCDDETSISTDLVRSCLDGNRDAMWARVAAATASPAGARAAAAHSDLWPVVAECSDEELMRRQPLPGDPESLARLQELTDWIGRMRVAPQVPLDEVDDRLAEARELGHLPTLALALIVVGRRISSTDEARANALYEEAFTVASEGGAERRALSAAVSAGGFAANHGTIEQTRRWVRSALAMTERISNPGRNAVSAHMNMAIAYANGQRWDDAIASLEDALRRADEDLPPDHPAYVDVYRTVAAIYAKTDDVDLAIDYARVALSRLDPELEADTARANEITAVLAAAYRNADRLVEAEAQLRAIIDQRQTHPATRFQTAGNLAILLADYGRDYDGLQLIEEHEGRPYEGYETGYANMLACKGAVLKNLDHLDGAADAFRRARALYDRHLPPGHAWIQRVDHQLDLLQPSALEPVMPGYER